MVVQERIAGWIRWAAQQLNVELLASEVDLGVWLWEDAWGEVYDLIIDQYTADEADRLVETVRAGDLAIMAVALAVQDEAVREAAVEKLLHRLDRRLTAAAAQ